LFFMVMSCDVLPGIVAPLDVAELATRIPAVP